MDGSHFDTLTRSLTGVRSRRGALGALLAGTLSSFGVTETEAKKKKKKKKKKRPTTTSPDPVPPLPPPGCPTGQDACGGICCKTGEVCADPAAQTCKIEGGICTSATDICKTFDANASRCDDQTRPSRCQCQQTQADRPFCAGLGQACFSCSSDSECESHLTTAGARCLPCDCCGCGSDTYCVPPCANPQLP